MQQVANTAVDFAIEELEARFEMEAIPGAPSTDWTCTCSISDK